MCVCGWVCGCDCGCVSIAYQNHIRCMPFAICFRCGAVGLDAAQLGKNIVLWLWWQGPLQMELHDVWWCLIVFWMNFIKMLKGFWFEISCYKLLRAVGMFLIKKHKPFRYLFWTFSASWGPILRRPAWRSTRLTLIFLRFGEMSHHRNLQNISKSWYLS